MKSRLLLVDDNLDFLDSTKDVLEDADYKVITASSGEEALAISSEQSFDIVLMDMKMPGLNGLETFLRMKENNPRIKVVLITAFSMGDLVRNALKEGVYDVLNKPLDVTRLLNLIEKIRENREKGCILIVDDDKYLCDNLSDSLLNAGYSVSSTFDGIQAVKKAKTDSFDILLLDIRLPGKNGLEIYQDIKKIQPNLVTIIITGYAEEFSEQIKAMNENVYACINKPIDMHNLLTILKQVNSDARLNNIIKYSKS